MRSHLKALHGRATTPERSKLMMHSNAIHGGSTGYVRPRQAPWWLRAVALAAVASGLVWLAGAIMGSWGRRGSL